MSRNVYEKRMFWLSFFLLCTQSTSMSLCSLAQSTIDWITQLPLLCVVEIPFQAGTWRRWAGFLPPPVARSLCISTLSAQRFWLYWAYLWHRCINKLESFPLCACLMVSVPGSQPGRWRSQGTVWLHRLSALGPSGQTRESHWTWICVYETSRKSTELTGLSVKC